MARKQLGAPPINPTDTTTKSYVDNQVGGVVPGSTIIDPTITNYAESVVQVGVVGAAYTFDLTAGTVQVVTLTASTLTTFTMPPVVPGLSKSFVAMINQPASTGGQGSVAFAGVYWPSGVAPTVTATPGQMDIFSFISDGVNWYGSKSQGYSTGADLTAGARTAIIVPNYGPMSPAGTALTTLRAVRRAGKDNLQAH